MSTTSYTFIKGVAARDLVSELKKAYDIIETVAFNEEEEWISCQDNTVIIGLSSSPWGIMSFANPLKYHDFFKALSFKFKTEVFVAYYQSTMGDCSLHLYVSGELRLKIEQYYDKSSGDIVQGDHYFKSSGEREQIIKYFEPSHQKNRIWFDYYEIQNYMMSKGVVYDAVGNNEFLCCRISAYNAIYPSWDGTR